MNNIPLKTPFNTLLFIVLLLCSLPIWSQVNEDFEGGAVGWVTSGSAATGTFVVANPSEQETSGVITQPEDDNTVGGVNAYYTATNSSVGSEDVDAGTAITTSPVYAVTTSSNLSIWYFHGQRDTGDDANDFFLLEYSLNGGTTYLPLVNIGDVRTVAIWQEATAVIPAGSDVVIRVTVSDGSGPGDIIEGVIDDLTITSSPDNDNDGISDIVDLDDDNDGILDTFEGCGVTTNISSTVGIGNAVTNTTYDLGDVDVTYTLDNPNGASVTGFIAGLNGPSIRILGNSGATDIGTLTTAFSSPVAEVSFKITDLDAREEYTVNVYDENNVLYDLTLGGLVVVGSSIAQTGNDFIETSNGVDRDGNNPASDVFSSLVFFFPNKVSRIEIEFDHSGAQSTRFIQPTFCSLVDTDNDGIPDQYDTDSDGDGCNDADEAYTDANADADDNGTYGTGIPVVNPDGTVVGPSYAAPSDQNTNTVFDFQEAGIAPSITTQPTNALTCPGCGTSFSVDATNGNTYQWQRLNGTVWGDLAEGGIFSGTTTNTLMVTAPTVANNGDQFRVVVVNTSFICEVETSIPALLTIQANSVITNRRITYRVNKS